MNAALLSFVLVASSPAQASPPPQPTQQEIDAFNARLETERKRNEKHALAVLAARVVVPRVVKRGERVAIVYEIASSSSKPATVETGRSTCHQMSIEQRGPDGVWHEVWDSEAKGRAQARVVGAELACMGVGFAPTITQDHPYRLEVSWDQTNVLGLPVPPGVYRAVVQKRTYNPELPPPNPAVFEIR
jgi:hypothetical protein